MNIVEMVLAACSRAIETLEKAQASTERGSREPFREFQQRTGKIALEELAKLRSLGETCDGAKVEFGGVVTLRSKSSATGANGAVATDGAPKATA